MVPHALLVGMDPSLGLRLGVELPECDRWRIVLLVTGASLAPLQTGEEIYLWEEVGPPFWVLFSPLFLSFKESADTIKIVD